MRSSSPAPSEMTLASSTEDVDAAIDATQASSDATRADTGTNAPDLVLESSLDNDNTDTIHVPSASNPKKRRLEDDSPGTVQESTSSVVEKTCVDLTDRTPNGDQSHPAMHSEGSSAENDGPVAKRQRQNDVEPEVQPVAATSHTIAQAPKGVLDGDLPSTLKAVLTLTPLSPKRPRLQDDSVTLDSPPTKRARLESSKAPFVTNDGAMSSTDPLDASGSGLVPDITVKTSGFLKLPLELLAEILILTGSPQHVLSVARTSKALCHTLLSPDAQFVWREARQGYGCTFEVETDQVQSNQNAPPSLVVKVFKLPDPPPQFFGEAAFAAFMYDSGACDTCLRETSIMYSSFALRTRACKNRKCRSGQNSEILAPTYKYSHDAISTAVRAILPSNEADFQTSIQTRTTFNVRLVVWPHLAETLNFVRTENFNAARREYVARHDQRKYQAKFEALKLRKKQWMEFCVDLNNWKRARQVQYYKTKAANENLGKQFASKFGWEYKDLVDTAVYATYQSRKTKLIEKLDETDIKIMKDQIEAQLLAHAERVERRNAEIALMNNRKEIEGLYTRLRSKNDQPYLPALSTFRKLPVVSMLQTAEPGTSKASVTQTLESNPMMSGLLSSQTKKWTETAMQDFGVILGFPKNWKSASKNILHPVERVTARFLCTKCKRVNTKYRDDEALDFAGACAHECGVGNARKGRIAKGKKNAWEAANFVKDEKAIIALRKCLEGLGFAEDRDGGNYMLKKGIAVVCASCDPPMVLDTRNIIGHSHRHDNIEIVFESLDKIVSYLGPYPYAYGVTQKLLGPMESSVAVKAEIDRKNFGCRLCLRIQQTTEAAAVAAAGVEANLTSASTNDATDSIMNDANANDSKAQIELSTLVSRMHDHGVEGPLEKPPLLFSFNGMRSHLKSKHGVENIRDEDIFCYRELFV